MPRTATQVDMPKLLLCGDKFAASAWALPPTAKEARRFELREAGRPLCTIASRPSGPHCTCSTFRRDRSCEHTRAAQLVGLL